MYKATRELIKQRQQHSEYVLEVVKVEKRPSMARGRCQRNSHEQVDSNDDLMLVSGWLIYPYDKFTNSTEIVQHWWNYSISQRIYFDVTEGEFNDCEYLTDLSIYQYASRNYEILESTVGKSLLLKDGEFMTAEKSFNTIKLEYIEHLETRCFFKHM